MEREFGRGRVLLHSKEDFRALHIPSSSGTQGPCRGTRLFQDFLACDGMVCLATWLMSLGLLVIAGRAMRNIVAVNQVGVVRVPPGSQTHFRSLSPLVDG